MGDDGGLSKTYRPLAKNIVYHVAAGKVGVMVSVVDSGGASLEELVAWEMALHA